MRIHYLLAIILISGAVSALKVSFLYSQTCPHCHEMRPEWDKVVARFEGEEIEFLEFDVNTPSGATLSQALGNRYVPSVYLDDTRIVQGSRSDFENYVSRKICESLNDSAGPCPIAAGTGLDPTLFLFPAILILLLGYGYKEGWLKK